MAKRGVIRLIKYNAVVTEVIADRAASRAADRAIKFAREELAKGGHNDTGKLSRSIKKKRIRGRFGPGYQIFAEAEYGLWVERGTARGGSGYITPTSSKFLAVKLGKRSGGSQKVVYLRKVRGQRPVKYMQKAIKRISVVDFTRVR